MPATEATSIRSCKYQLKCNTNQVQEGEPAQELSIALQ